MIVFLNTIWRTWRPLSIRDGRTAPSGGLLVIDLGIHVTAAVISHCWESPFVFAIVVSILVAGFQRGYSEAFVAAAAAVAALSVGGETIAPSGQSAQTATQVVLLYVLSAALAGYAQRLFLEAEEREEEAAGRVAKLTEANELLSELHRLTQTLPSSLDLGETLAAGLARLRELFDFSAVAVLISDSATRTWRVEVAEGLRIPPELRTDELPGSLRQAVETRVSIAAGDTWAASAAGLAPRARSGLYAPLVARGRLVAVVAIEHTEPARFGERQLEMMEGFAEPFALAIDNALWFNRLRVLGAEGERSRMARQLHDRIGQGLAYVAMELDRIRTKEGSAEDLARLSEDTRGLLAEVRETLHQLRADVSEATSLADVARMHLERFEKRTGIQAVLRAPELPARLPVRVEQELWRILQEALANVERHSEAERVWVFWSVDGLRGRLQVRDDGRGFDISRVHPSHASGMMAMRERANAVGGRLDIDSTPGQGTVITVVTEVPT